MSSQSDTQISRASTGERLLQERLGTRERAERFYDKQVLDHLNEPMRRFIERQQMMFLSTSDASGSCDSTLRAGPPGFVVVLDSGRLAWPEYRGNGVMASLGNISENPHVGLLFVDFVRDVIGLHVNGGAEVVDDDELRLAYPDLPVDPVPGRRAEQWVVAHVHEAYIHCAKHIPRLYEDPRDGQRQHQPQPQPKKSDYFAVVDTSRPTARPDATDSASLLARPPQPRPIPTEVRGCTPVVTSPVSAGEHGVVTWRHRLRHVLPRRLRNPS
jgi:hypothetical protein